MKTVATLLLLGATLGLTACGENTATRATTGATAGAVIAGPIGAAAGGIAGATGLVQVK